LFGLKPQKKFSMCCSQKRNQFLQRSSRFVSEKNVRKKKKNQKEKNHQQTELYDC